LLGLKLATKCRTTLSRPNYVILKVFTEGKNEVGFYPKKAQKTIQRVYTACIKTIQYVYTACIEIIQRVYTACIVKMGIFCV